MCGLCGIANADPDRPIEVDVLTRMREAISHRGPDDFGQRIDRGIGIAHRRLSIIDIAGGHQPLANEDDSIWLVYNGELYNYQELTERLEGLGHVFRTRSDSEVLVHAYEEYGLDFVRHLNGMFGFALHDVRRDRLVIARDHMGIKPMFYAVEDGRLFFGSEIKAILAAAKSRPTVDRAALQEYLIFRYPAWDRTLFEGIHRLPPGHLGVWENGALKVHSFWSPPEPEAADRTGVADELEHHLGRSVNEQLISEVPLGTFCSGGVDSGLVTGFAAAASDHQLETFSVAFDDPDWDETALARDTAGRFGTRHHVITARQNDFSDHLPKLIGFNDEPLSHPNSVPIYVLSGLAREHVTVVLTGEGADELFCGYPRYHIARLRGAMSKVPGWVVEATAGLAGQLPHHRARRLGELLPFDPHDAVVFNSAYVMPDVIAALTGTSTDPAVERRRELVDRTWVEGDSVASLSRYEVLTYLVCALDRMDRMSMAHGLEGRVPFLDVPLAEWALRLPTAAKLRGRENKRIVKDVGRRHLGSAVVDGPKSGFGIPLADWFRDPGFGGFVDRLRDPDHGASEFIDTGMTGRVLAEHMDGSRDWSELLWLLTNLYVWFEERVG